MPSNTTKPAKNPNYRCPFTDTPIEVRKVGGHLWQGVVSTPDGGYVTQLFRTEAELLYFISIRQGVNPAFPKMGSVITVRERTAPVPDPVAADKDEERVLHEAAREAVDHVVHDLVR